MLTKDQLDKYADVLIWALETARTEKFNDNDIVLIRYHKPAIQLAEILYSKLLKKKLYPVQRIAQTPDMEKNFYLLSEDTQLTFQLPGEKELFKNLNGSIYLHAPESLTHLKNIEPEKTGIAAKSRKYLKDILNMRDDAGLFGWTLCMMPTKVLAKHANLTDQEYTDQIIKACFLDKKSPVSHWQSIYKQGLTIKKWLNSLNIKKIHVESENTDLTIYPGEKRKWIGLTGHNIPSFEIFLSPDWRKTHGIYFSNLPSYKNGHYIKNIRLEFKHGVAVKIEAEEGETFVKTQLALDFGANKIGEFSLTDKTFSKINKFMANTLFDENFGGQYGNCHIALGSSYSDTYNGNPKHLTADMKNELGFNDSALHWDIVNTEQKRVTVTLATGEKTVIYENGSFLL